MSDNGDDNIDVTTLQQQMAVLQLQSAAMQAQNPQQNVQPQPLQPNQLAVPDIKPITQVKVPEGQYNMSPADFRTYSKDILDYQILTQYTERQVVLQLRMHMDFDLKRAIDTNFINQLDNFNVNEALSAIKRIVQKNSNIAVFRKEFDNTNQKASESIQPDLKFVLPIVLLSAHLILSMT